MLLTNDSPRDDASLDARRAADRWMHERYRRTRDPRHRDELIERYMPLAHHLARRYQRGSDNFEDIAQVATVGLINAVDRFDPARGMAFSSFAVPTISGELAGDRRLFSSAQELGHAHIVRAGPDDTSQNCLSRTRRSVPPVGLHDGMAGFPGGSARAYARIPGTCQRL